MATRPSEKPAWVPSNDPAKIVAPSASKKNTGWLQEEKPPFQYFNWFWNLLDQWIDYFGGYVRYNVVIDSVAEEADFSSLAAYISGTPAAGDRVLVKTGEVLTATLAIPAGIEVTFLKDVAFTLATNFTPIMTLADRSALIGTVKIENSDTGTIAKAVSINGDLAYVEDLVIENKSSGTISTAFTIESGKTQNNIRGAATNTGAGAITTDFTDSSTNLTNNVVIRGDANIHISGYKKYVSDGITVDGAVATGTTLLPVDDTIPQITEGDEYMTLAYTPKDATNILVIEARGFFAQSAASQGITMALFRDAVANALIAVGDVFGTDSGAPLSLCYRMVAGTTSAITFRVRAGSVAAATVTFNGAGGARYYGGVLNSFIKVTEYSA